MRNQIEWLQIQKLMVSTGITLLCAGVVLTGSVIWKGARQLQSPIIGHDLDRAVINVVIVSATISILGLVIGGLGVYSGYNRVIRFGWNGERQPLFGNNQNIIFYHETPPPVAVNEVRLTLHGDADSDSNRYNAYTATISKGPQ